MLLTEDIYLSQSDIRHVQLLLGAILSGCVDPVRCRTGTVEQLDRVIIAGQSGLHLTAESIIGSGLLPKTRLDKISYVGNCQPGAALAFYQ